MLLSADCRMVWLLQACGDARKAGVALSSLLIRGSGCGGYTGSRPGYRLLLRLVLLPEDLPEGAEERGCTEEDRGAGETEGARFTVPRLRLWLTLRGALLRLTVPRLPCERVTLLRPTELLRELLRPTEPLLRLDRKSTRLNSSHVAIS